MLPAIFDDMGTHMKTTLDISDPLLEAAKALALREATTLRAVVEEGLRSVLARKQKQGPLRSRDASFKGRGLHPDFVARGGWSKLREAAYDEEDEP